MERATEFQSVSAAGRLIRSGSQPVQVRALILAPLLFFLCTVLSAQTIYLNAGGPAVPGIMTPTYQADQWFSGGAIWNEASPGYDPPGTGALATLRYGPVFSYDVPVHNGFYSITFHLVEPNKTGPGQRLFTITANGIQSDPLDIFALAGFAKLDHPVTLFVLVGNGHLRITFAASLGNAVVSAMDIVAVANPLGWR